MKSIIFVDDDPNMLDGIKRMLKFKLKSDEWELSFANGGEQALKMMEERPIDVVVSDMRMPGMDGVQLLNTVMERRPQTVRFILSGYSDRELIIRSIGSTHQYISKPCDPDHLVNTITRAFALRSILQKDSLKQLITQIKTLPALPDLYLKVMGELKSPEASVQKVGELIAKDLAMSAKVLQLVNSAFFGMRRHIENTSQAVSLLGLDVIKSMVLMLKVFEQSGSGDKVAGLSMKWLWEHSFRVAQCSQLIMRNSNTDKKASDDAFMAGLFHDLGKLVLAASLSARMGKAYASIATGRDAMEAENAEFGGTHAEVGAYLLGLWGFPDPLIEAALYHHQPSKSHLETFTSLTATHLSNAFAHEAFPQEGGGTAPGLDGAYLERLKIAPDKLSELRTIFQSAMKGS